MRSGHELYRFREFQDHPTFFSYKNLGFLFKGEVPEGSVGVGIPPRSGGDFYSGGDSPPHTRSAGGEQLPPKVPPAPGGTFWPSGGGAGGSTFLRKI